ncbi:HlyD family secretion protein [Maribacter flavus]|uniref:HlyD family efflux transporter periplasmic adaptor subunit n=1 Tax=Maribacter flavus TaxID=1658664 RepID=A0A5B2TXZ4_9FLAO|nr:HlyD family efflux transporter periplasmic adaptor subunit [Maribacter flavus]KAA2218520.1 HlyD family efflux transporter periplasmic adaptor subunit [Maribacter flavus]
MKIDQFDERSDQVREILGKAPNWIVSVGISVVFVIVILLIAGSTLISYNDIISAKIIVTSKNPPVYLKANSSGRINNIFVTHGQEVEKNEVLAEIENTAKLEDVQYLNYKLKNFNVGITNLDSLNNTFPPYLDLGNIQLAYGEFLTQYQNFILFSSLMPNERESIMIANQLKEQLNFLEKQKIQKKIFEEDLELSKDSYSRSETLFKKGVISKSEFENASRQYLSDKQRFEGFLTSIANTQIAIANFNKLLTKSDIQSKEFENMYKQELDKTYQVLNNELLLWEQQYLLKSPINGTVTVFDIWNQYQNVNLGETLFTVVPVDFEEIIGRVSLPIRNSGKVKVGQKVIIKLSNYPFEEWGNLSGKIINISEVPKQGKDSAYYTIYVALKNLRTSYHKKIQFKQEMQGTAEIVIEELSILQRIFYQFRNFTNRS